MSFTKYREFYNRIQYFRDIQSLLQWDSEVMMPSSGRMARSHQIAEMSKLIHELFTGDEFKHLLDRAEEDTSRNSNYNNIDFKKKELKVIKERLDKQSKLPTAFVQELSQKTNIAQAKWEEAKGKKDFSLFSSTLEELVDLAIRQADYYGYEKERYDALLDDYEKSATGESLAKLFQDLKKELIPIVGNAKSYPNPFTKKVPPALQKVFCESIPTFLGLTSDLSRLDSSAHPFSTSLGPKDKRITTRYDESDPLSSIFGVMHETGHSLYEVGLSEIQEAPHPIAEYLSLGMHESQSRLWENQVGRSEEFWQFYYPLALEAWNLKESELPFEKLIQSIRSVEKTKIRVEADPVTYNLHIILRFEIERDLIAQKIKVTDLPDIWNAKMKESFDLTIDHPAEGVLQDVHWSMAAFGYFPTYALGNIYSAQLYSAFLKSDPNFPKTLANSGNTSSLLSWLKRNVHHQGKLLSVDELIEKATGSKPSSRFLVESLTNFR